MKPTFEQLESRDTPSRLTLASFFARQAPVHHAVHVAPQPLFITVNVVPIVNHGGLFEAAIVPSKPLSRVFYPYLAGFIEPGAFDGATGLVDGRIGIRGNSLIYTAHFPADFQPHLVFAAGAFDSFTSAVEYSMIFFIHA